MKYSKMYRALAPSEFVALQIMVAGCSISMGILILIVYRISPLHQPFAFIGFMALLSMLGFMIPIMPMDNAIVKRQQSILRNWPFFMDLLTISIEAGMDFATAAKRIVKTMSLNPLTEELLQFLNEVQLGKRKIDAIQAMSDRINLPVIESILMMLIQAETLGTPLAPLLRNQTRAFREHKSQLVEKKAMEAPVKMLLPLLLFIFPAILIVLLGPVMIQYMSAQ